MVKEYDMIIEYLGQHPRSSRQEICGGTGFKGSDASLKRLLHSAVELGDAVSEGNGRATCYSRAVPIYSGKNRKHPYGLQTFEHIVTGGYVYVDKSELVYNLANNPAKYVFLSRPRRFGKSLLVSTLKSYFEGRKDLFAGLAISKFEKDWVRYPVVRLDLSLAGTSFDSDDLRSRLSRILRQNEDELGLEHVEDTPGGRLASLVRNAYAKYGQGVVVLIDEYDAPLHEVIFDTENGPVYKRIMKDLFSPLKNLDPYLRFVFLTGISKFSQLSIFSALNNMRDISLSNEFSSICGFTEAEIDKYFDVDIIEMASRMGKNPEEMHEMIKMQYDGYHFSASCEDIYNPFSMLGLFMEKEFSNYWFGSGTPTLLYETLGRFNQDMAGIDNAEARADEFSIPTETVQNAIPLFYQSGYLTIKSYDPLEQTYVLGIPNSEVRTGLFRDLLPAMVGKKRMETSNFAYEFLRPLRRGDVQEAMEALKAFLASIPYPEFGEGFRNSFEEREAYYKRLFYVVFSFMNIRVYTEVMNSCGRTDAVMVFDDAIYVVEFKLDAASAKEAVAQIDARGYAERFSARKRKVFKLGLNFSSESRNLDSWALEEA